MSTDEGWRSFNADFLMPLVREVGARTYELISGTRLHLDHTIKFPEYLARFPQESRGRVRTAVLTFLDPKDSQVRSYVLRCAAISAERNAPGIKILLTS
jgi:hypothetical protein